MSVVNPEPLTHLVVRASAGAGKTFQLTTRYLDLLARHEPTQNILATTFTRKAAGEVMDRVLSRLASACSDERHRRALGDALEQPCLSRADCITMLRCVTESLHRLSVGTIDSFFNRAARAMAMDLGLPPDPRLIDEGSPLAQQMRFDAIQAVLGEHADNDQGLTTLIEMLRRLHHDTAQRSVTEAMDHIVKDLGDVYQSYPDRSLWDQLPDTGRLSADLLTIAIEALDQMAPYLPLTKAGSFNKGFKKAYEAMLADARSGYWDNFLANGLIKKLIDGETTFSRVELSEDWLTAIKPLMVHAKAVRLGALADQTRATFDLLEMFDRHYRAARYAQRVLLFSDLTHLLAQGLPGLGEAGVEELCYRLDAKVTHLLLDEFQDTSLRQWDVLKPFAEQIASTSDGSRSLFCVGDTKQAIYGWRGGCAELFDAVQSYPGVEPALLSKSYRSSQIVLDAVNQVFTSLVGNAALSDCQRAASKWQRGFELHEAVQRDLPGHVVLHTTTSSDGTDNADMGDDDASAPPDQHAHDTARYIKDLAAQMPGRRVGVLMRSRAKAKTLMHALRSLGVRAAEEGGNPISHNAAVAAVLAAIQFADHPGDTVARFHTINSPIGEVLGFDRSTNPEQFARQLRRALIDQGYGQVIAQWTQRLAPSCDAASLRRLMQLVELAEEYDAFGATLRPSFFVQSVRAAKVEDASPASVRVMTIHASKGLEFDAVVLPDLDANLSAQDARDLVVLDRDSPIDPVRGIYRRLPKDLSSLTLDLQHAHDQRAQEKRTEDLCLLYVAMTRAKQALHMLVRPLKQSSSGKPTSTGLTNLSYAAILRQALRDSDKEGFAGDERLFETGSADWAGAPAEPDDLATPPTSKPDPIRLTPSEGKVSRSWVKASPSQMHNQARVSVDDLLSLNATAGQQYGTAIHAMLQHVGFIDEGALDEQAMRNAGERAGLKGPDLDQTLARLRHILDQPAAQSLLQRVGADELWRERRFMTRLDNRLIAGSFDRVHLWHQGGKPIRALLIDYKTDRVDDASIDAKVAGYADQLRLYRAALSAMISIEPAAIETKLYFVGDGRVADVS